MSNNESNDSRLVPAVERASRLLDALALARQPQSLADLARALSLPKSSLHGLLATLVSLGLARRDHLGTFSLGPKPLEWAEAYASQSDVLAAFDAQVGGNGPLHSETVMLAVLDATDITYLACRQGSRPLAVNYRVGGRFPAACTASGKAILLTMHDDEVRALYADEPPQRMTRYSVTSVTTLMRQLGEFRQRGYTIDDEETAEGMHCFGAAVFAARRTTAVAAVSVSAIKAAVTPKRRTELIAAIRQLAAAMSAQLGAPQPDPGPGPLRKTSGKETPVGAERS